MEDYGRVCINDMMGCTINAYSATVDPKLLWLAPELVRTMFVSFSALKKLAGIENPKLKICLTVFF